MTKIAVIGNAGGGKTTLCRRLGSLLNIPVHTVDLFQWQPGWVATPYPQLAEIHQSWLQNETWIIDGFGAWDLIERRFQQADTLILVDYPLYIHFWWAFKRQIRDVFSPRDDLPPNCPMLPRTRDLIEVMLRVHREMRPQLLETMQNIAKDNNGAIRFIHLRSPKEMKQFLKAL